MWKQFIFCPAFFLALNREFEAFLSLFSFYDKNYTFPLSALFVEYKRLKMFFSKLFYYLILTQNTRTAQYTLSFSLSHTHTHAHTRTRTCTQYTHMANFFVHFELKRSTTHLLLRLWRSEAFVTAVTSTYSLPYQLVQIWEVRYCLTTQRLCSLNFRYQNTGRTF